MSEKPRILFAFPLFDRTTQFSPPMSLDLSQYTQPLEIALEQKKQVLTVPYICNSMTVTPTTAKLYLPSLVVLSCIGFCGRLRRRRVIPWS